MVIMQGGQGLLLHVPTQLALYLNRVILCCLSEVISRI